MRRGRLEAGESAVIIGAGGVGAFLTYAASRIGAETIVLDLEEDRLEVATRLGARRVIRPTSMAELHEVMVRKLIPTVIYEVTGRPDGLRLAVEIAQPGTRLVVVGIQGQPTELELGKVTLGEMELIGTNAHVFGLDFPDALSLLASRAGGWADIAPIALPLGQLVDEGLMPMVEGRSTRIKTLIDPWAEEARPTT